MQQRFTTYTNKKRKKVFLLKKKNKIYFLIKNLKSKEKNKKFDSLKVDAFFIKEVKGPKIYELNFSKIAKIHKTFDVFLLKLTNFNALIQEIFHY